MVGPGNDATFDNLAPGTYRMIALNQVVMVNDLDPATLNTYLSKGQTVTVEAQGSASVALDVINVTDAGAESETAQ